MADSPCCNGTLNQVERWFSTLTERFIRGGTHRSTRELEQAIRAYLNVDNSASRPFTWSRTADDILVSIERLCLQSSRSGH